MCEKVVGVGGSSAIVERFIQRARQKHGDYYDYSLVTEKDYRRGKVTIVCPKHGPFQQWTNVHLKLRDNGGGYMGCRTCGFDKMSNGKFCKQCGERARGACNGLCKACTKKKFDDRKIRSQTRFECPQCGKKHGRHSTKFCSIKCWKENVKQREKKEVVQCIVCGVDIVRYKSKKRERCVAACCGNECANEWNSIKGRARSETWEARISRGRMARDKWRNACRAKRKKDSQVMAWLSAYRKSRYVSSRCEWTKRCASGSQAVRTRKRVNEFSHRQKTYAENICLTWDLTCFAELLRFHDKKMRRDIDPWKKKAVNWVGNIKHRRYRVNQAKTSGNGKGTAPISPEPRVQVCFEWVEDHATNGED